MSDGNRLSLLEEELTAKRAEIAHDEAEAGRILMEIIELRRQKANVEELLARHEANASTAERIVISIGKAFRWCTGR